MRYENIKSIILTFLVCVSILLTWNLWTYQPNYETMDSHNYVEEVNLGGKQEVSNVILPDQVLYHIDGKHYGTNNSGELDKVIKEVSKWTIIDVKNVTEKVPNFNELIHGSGNAEIVFPNEVPIELYRSVLNVEGRKIPSFNFDRIIINVEDSGKNNGVMYFASTKVRHVYESHISLTDVSSFRRSFFNQAKKMPTYFSYKPTKNRTIFLPEEETKMTTNNFILNTLDSDKIKEALFDDPSFVQKSIISTGEEYTNDSSKMTVNKDKNMLSYVNPTVEDDYVENAYDLVKRSIDFVNEHGGWTDQFRYVAKDEYNRSVTFRLYSSDGYPVFNDYGLSEITEVWGRNDNRFKINKYIRPNISMELALATEAKDVTLPSGYQVLELIQGKEDFKPELLEQIVLGYQMKKVSNENRLVLLKPAWFYRYDYSWESITKENLGGTSHGLE
ncbi:YycH family regulatory protein [Bacillus rubiinfantis]|uniref:YycH family regulatory protein n=1 Tax=Bacillus rubiinfantis TaxID=1499680 RepID=UPI0005A9437E|nr:two-component system activity regulator YycH [Bacillus rubiinfantis]